jgi:hypothetical protein
MFDIGWLLHILKVLKISFIPLCRAKEEVSGGLSLRVLAYKILTVVIFTPDLSQSKSYGYLICFYIDHNLQF